MYMSESTPELMDCSPEFLIRSAKALGGRNLMSTAELEFVTGEMELLARSEGNEDQVHDALERYRVDFLRRWIDLLGLNWLHGLPNGLSTCPPVDE